MYPTSTSKLPVDLKIPAVLSSYRLCQTPHRPYASISPFSVSVYATLQLSVLRTDEAVNYCLHSKYYNYKKEELCIKKVKKKQGKFLREKV